MKLRDGEKGEVAAEFLTCRVFVWNGKDERARSWHLLVRREIGGQKMKYSLSNARPSASLAWPSIRCAAGWPGITIWRWC
jgi:hypothetical protein